MEKALPDNDLNEIIELATKWQKRANELITKKEKANQERVRQLILHPLDKAFFTKLIDQCFRSRDVKRVAEQITFLLKRSSFPDFFSIGDVLLMWLFLVFGRRFPKIAVPIMINKIRKDSGYSILPGEPKTLDSILKKRRQQRIKMNLNRLSGPASGKKEANARLSTIIQDLKNPEINYISLNVSSICPQLHPFSFDNQLEWLVERLANIFQAAMNTPFKDDIGIETPKFVNLDVEYCTELEITSQAFKLVLDREEFKTFSAGIALQAYLPESFIIQQQLTSWALNRRKAGGNPIKIRIVKGANLEMEKIKASQFGWPLATYQEKQEVDKSYKNMIDFGLKQENFKAVHLGIASHNLFDLAYGFHKAKKQHATDYVNLEMYFAVAGHVQRAIREDSENLVLYAPIAKKREFINSVGYLIRRLDENTGQDNFLRHAVGLTTDSREWNILKDLFITSCEGKANLSDTSHRTQNRKTETYSKKTGTYHLGKFDNEPITDWSLAENRIWAQDIRENWMGPRPEFPCRIPLVIEGKELEEYKNQKTCFDPSLLPQEISVSIISQGQRDHVEKAIQTAKSDSDKWREKTLNERHEILSQVAQNIRRARGDLIGATAATTGRVFTEIDIEISRAIDYVEYYPYSVKPFIEPRYLENHGKGVGVVITPKTNPIASPCDGIAAALATGNTVILKPSSEATTPAWLLCQCFWQAGISKNTLQFLPGKGSDIGEQLAIHQDVDFVILNGHQDTARSLLNAKPDIDLYAQISSKNTMTVTAVSDKEQAIRIIIESAFGDSGQKNSAVSLLILEKEVFNDLRFKKLLVDAATSFSSGPCWDFKNKMGPLSSPAKGDLLRALTKLEEGESWALKPILAKENNHLWSPGIKWDVQPGSSTHLTEFFGPVLGVMCANSFQNAIDLANQPGYGTTAGLQCLDKLKQEIWKNQIRSGNLFINGHTTNAYVLRQPFGGWGKSVIGRGAKSGGPNYVTQFMKFNEIGSPAEVATKYDRRLLRLAKNWMRKTDRSEFKEFQTDIQKSVRAMNSFLYHARHEFRIEKDLFHLRGQDNTIRYFPVGKVAIRVHPEDSLFETLARIAAAQTAKCKVVVSVPQDLDSKIISFLKKRERREFLRKIKITSQSDEQLIESMDKINRIRYASPERVPQAVYLAAARKGFLIVSDRVLMEGRIELLHYYRSQSTCNNYHRYGNLGARAFDQSMNSVRLTGI